MMWMFTQTDKLQHLAAGTALVQFLLAALLWFMPYGTALATAAAAAVVFAAAKEVVWDKWMKRGVCNWRDFVASLAGIAAGAALSTFYLIRI